MHTPIILLVGQAGSGKDTIAGFLVKNHGAISIAQADPMKRLAAILFDFSEDQLWGPSESRNAVDPRYAGLRDWQSVWNRMFQPEIREWLVDLFCADDVEPQLDALREWLVFVERESAKNDWKLTPRFVLQTLGTEWGRAQGRDTWSAYTIEKALDLLGGGYRYDRTKGVFADSSYPGPALVVVTDGRFKNEVVNVHTVNGVVVRIDSPSADGSAAEKAGVAGHASESEQRGIPRHFFSAFFHNDKAHGLNACEAWTRALVEDLSQPLVVVGEYPLGRVP